MQTILGSGGAIGNELAKVLPEYSEKIRLVSRNPKVVSGTEELVKADLLIPQEVNKSIVGSEVVYLTVGLPYNIKVWESNWPIIMKNVIYACKKYNTKLVFFDNVYMYDPNYLNPMTEETPLNPISKKGKVRKEIAEMLIQETEKGNLKALIARSADFYGPSIKNTSVLTETVFKNLKAGKKADWLGDINKKHSYTYTPDAGKATALVGNTEDAYNQVWHLPTASDPFSGEEWITAIAKELGVEPRYRTISRSMTKLLGLFVPIMRELKEMYYQNDRDYEFNSDKFKKRFGIKATPYLEGIKSIVDQDYK
jgi:nucleoside-diphosphate-sugar epimerase